jgi:4-hydroxy-3-polyprenylbenzoate decarboxylase
MVHIKKKFAVGITGASGIPYGIRLVEALARLGHEVLVVVSDAGREVMRLECGCAPGILTKLGVTLYREDDISAPIASGSYPLDAMVIIPCTMATLSAVAHGQANNLIHRGADVALKERRTLILVPRETALNRIHLKNMLLAHDAGAIIMPAMPPFYGNPSTVNELVSHMAGRILDRLGIENDLAPRWKGPAE